MSILDVKARDAAGRQFNVEMQMEYHPAYPARIVYYLAKMHEQQLREGKEFQELSPSYSISILDHVLYRQRPRWHWRFRLRDEEEPGVVFSDHLAVHIIELPKFDRAAADVGTALERWCYFLRHGEELDRDRLPTPLQLPPIQKAMEVLQMVTQSELERERYLARDKFLRDEKTRLRAAREEGEAAGEQRGEERGILIGRVQLAEHLLKQAPTTRNTLRAMTLEQLEQLADQLEKRLAEPQLTELLPQPLQLSPIQKAMNVLQRVTQNELERERYEARVKSLRDQKTRLRGAREEGILIGRVQLAERLLKQAPPSLEALSALTLEELQELADRLEKQLADRG